MSSSLFRLKKHVLDTQHVRQFPHATLSGDDEILKICINQYTPLDNLQPQPGDVTIIAAHANGVGKELYEPMWDDLHAIAKKSGLFRIRNIWIADVAWQGESGVLNEHKLGKDPHWLDHSRDLLHMVNYFRDEMPRPLIGFGHSMGGCQIAYLSILHPRLLHSLILIEPVMQSLQSALSSSPGADPGYASTFRRDIWPSREAAAQAFRKNKFYQPWDPRALKLWIEHGLRELPTALYPEYPPITTAASEQKALIAASASATAAPVPPTSPTTKPVTLTTTKHQEVFTFLRPMHPAAGQPLSSFITTRLTHPDHGVPYGPAVVPTYNPSPVIAFEQLPHLRPHCFYIFGSASQMSSPALVEEKLQATGTAFDGNGGQAEGAVDHLIIEGAGHFVAFEQPTDVAEVIAKRMTTELARFKTEEALHRIEWEKLSTREKQTLSTDWEWWMKEGAKEASNKRKSKL